LLGRGLDDAETRARTPGRCIAMPSSSNALATHGLTKRGPDRGRAHRRRPAGRCSRHRRRAVARSLRCPTPACLALGDRHYSGALSRACNGEGQVADTSILNPGASNASYAWTTEGSERRATTPGRDAPGSWRALPVLSDGPWLACRTAPRIPGDTRHPAGKRDAWSMAGVRVGVDMVPRSYL
jgi:hypothetical protein